MKKVLLLLISIVMLTGCGKVDKDKLVDEFINKVESSKAYTLESEMELYNNEDTFTYDINVSHMDEDYFKVRMINKLSNHEQVILRNNNDVYVVTPSLNKCYKFVSEWPYNSSQSYILNTIVNDIKNEDEIEFKEEDDGYSLKVGVDYPNNVHLSYEKIYFDKDMNLKNVVVYDVDDIIALMVTFKKIDYKANLSENDFNVESLVDIYDDNEDNQSGEEDVSKLDDILYPLYIPANTYLKEKELISTDNGERAILTFNGEKNFVLIEETNTVSEEFEIIPVYGDPLMLNSSVGALSNNSLSWTNDDVSYYLASNDLTTDEILSIADSLNTVSIVTEK